MLYVAFTQAKGVMNALALLYVLLTRQAMTLHFTPHNWLGWKSLAGRETFYCLRLAAPEANISDVNIRQLPTDGITILPFRSRKCNIHLVTYCNQLLFPSSSARRTGILCPLSFR